MAFYKSCSYLHWNSNIFTTAHRKIKELDSSFTKLRRGSLEQRVNIIFEVLCKSIGSLLSTPKQGLLWSKHTTYMYRSVRLKDIILCNEKTLMILKMRHFSIKIICCLTFNFCSIIFLTKVNIT